MGSKGSSTPPEREPTAQELELLEAQSTSLEQAMKVAADQYNLSSSDRDYFDKIYRGALDKDDPKVLAEVQKRMQDIPPPNRSSFKSDSDFERAKVNYNSQKEVFANIAKFELGSGVSVDTLLFDAIKAASPETQKLMNTWESSARELGNDFINDMTGMSDTFKQQLTTANDEFVAGTRSSTSTMTKSLGDYQSGYEASVNKAMGNMGTADSDILAQTTGQNLAGIASSFKQSQDQLMSAMGRRGLAGSGVEAQALGGLAGQMGNTQAGALNQSYMQAIQQSDARRQQQLGMAGQLAATGQQTATNIGQAQSNMYGAVGTAQQSLAGQMFNTGSQMSNQAYGIQSQLSGQVLNQNIAAQQQNIANLQAGSGVSQGIYAGASNMLAGAGQTAGNNAQIAGTTATNIGATDAQYKTTMAQAAAEQEGAALGAAAGMATTAMMMMSDERLKTNIVKVDEVDGLNIYTWDWIEGHDYGYNEGYIAQEVLEMYPEAVEMQDNGYYAVDYSKVGV